MNPDQMLGMCCGAVSFLAVAFVGFAILAVGHWPKFWFGVAGIWVLLTAICFVIGALVYVSTKISS